LTHRKQGKAFFFEKKKQKAFYCAVADLAGKVRVSTRKSFLVLFLEKGLLACYESWSRPADKADGDKKEDDVFEQADLTVCIAFLRFDRRLDALFRRMQGRMAMSATPR
jgi:hypothetical protein